MLKQHSHADGVSFLSFLFLFEDNHIIKAHQNSQLHNELQNWWGGKQAGQGRPLVDFSEACKHLQKETKFTRRENAQLQVFRIQSPQFSAASQIHSVCIDKCIWLYALRQIQHKYKYNLLHHFAAIMHWNILWMLEDMLCMRYMSRLKDESVFRRMCVLYTYCRFLGGDLYFYFLLSKRVNQCHLVASKRNWGEKELISYLKGLIPQKGSIFIYFIHKLLWNSPLSCDWDF